MIATEFSHRARRHSLERMREARFDFLVIGGGITGVATARDAASRGLKVALIERGDFACGTSSNSSKLIHGGLRYLENLELGLVFEALSERHFLLRALPNLVKPLPFYLPSYVGDKVGKGMLGMGLWLYDTLALLRTPGFHERLGVEALRSVIPGLRADGLRGGFRYFDASMRDDAITAETARSAGAMGAAVANYCEALSPEWRDGRVSGFFARDRENGEELRIRAERTILCVGPWTDQLGVRVDPAWKHWLVPSKGVHLVFPLSKLPLPGAIVMTNPGDGRIAFAIPRPELGEGILIVGTTDGPTPDDPDLARVDAADVDYLFAILDRYFPGKPLSRAEVISAYVGVRPLAAEPHSPGKETAELRKVSREHHIAEGPGGTVVVAGGKFTTHREMAREIVDFALDAWRRNPAGSHPPHAGPSRTRLPLASAFTGEATAECEAAARARGASYPKEILDRYGAESEAIAELNAQVRTGDDPKGFAWLEAELAHAIRQTMVMHLGDFVLRRTALFLARADHGAPWFSRLARILAAERGLGPDWENRDLESLRAEVERRMGWARTGVASAAG